LVVGLGVVVGAWAQANGELRWRGGVSSLGLQAKGNELGGPCGSIAFPCEDSGGTLRLYTSPKAPRTLSLQLAYPEDPAPVARLSRPQAPNVSLIGRTDIAPSLGLYGRLGTATRASLAGAPGSEGGITYGVGLSWDFSRRGSATVGWDLYDFRALGGESRDVRATSLGLQWRY
jgi:OmpA-OmpF porin, OOP family